MSTKNSLYQEAVLDALKVKDCAVRDAQRSIIEAITPRIREFVEEHILSQNDGDDVFEDDVIEPIPDIVDMPSTVSNSETIEVLDQPIVQTQNPINVIGSDSLDQSVLPLLTAIKNNDAIGAASAIIDILKQTSALQMAMPQIQESKSFKKKISKLIESIDNMYHYVQENVSDPVLKTMVSERLEENFKDLKQLREDVMKKTTKTIKEDNEMDLDNSTEQPQTSEEKPTKRVSLNIDVPEELADQLVDSLGDIEISLDDEVEGEENVELDLGDTEGDELSLDVDADVEPEIEPNADKDDQELQLNSKELSDDTVVEIDENMLRRELSRMRSLKEDGFPVPSTKGAGAGDGNPFGDVDEGDPLDVDVTTEAKEDDDDKEMLLDKEETCEGSTQSMTTSTRAIANEQKVQRLASARGRALQVEGKKAKASKDVKRYNALKQQYLQEAKKFNESKTRENKIKVALTENAAKGNRSNSDPQANDLRKKLAESNLDNVKLTYANKLLRMNSLTTESKYKIVEQLEAATTVKEAKLIVENAVKLLSTKTSKKPEQIVENAGSASRPTRSSGVSQTLSEGYEVNRWARLAGIK
jgi:hypothetical protein